MDPPDAIEVEVVPDNFLRKYAPPYQRVDLLLGSDFLTQAGWTRHGSPGGVILQTANGGNCKRHP